MRECKIRPLVGPALALALVARGLAALAGRGGGACSSAFAARRKAAWAWRASATSRWLGHGSRVRCAMRAGRRPGGGRRAGARARGTRERLHERERADPHDLQCAHDRAEDAHEPRQQAGRIALIVTSSSPAASASVAGSSSTSATRLTPPRPMSCAARPAPPVGGGCRRRRRGRPRGRPGDAHQHAADGR